MRQAKPKVPIPLEKDIRDMIKEYLISCRWLPSIIRERYFRLGAKGEYSEPGIPDLIAIKGGRVVMFEVKRPMAYSKPNESQLKWHKEWRDHGGEVYVVKCLEDVMEACAGRRPNKEGY